MKILCDLKQGSTKWLEARTGIVTASEVHNLVTPEFKLRDGEMVKTYVAQKLAEKWGGPMLDFNSFATEQGELMEEEARAWISLELDRDIQEVGLCLTDDGRAGCSPDGLMDGEGLELKCPQPVAHTKYLLAGGVPKDYLAQVHFSMFVTGFASWRFVSYRRGFPTLMVVAKRDEKIQAALKQAVNVFHERYNTGMERLKSFEKVSA